MQGNDHSVPEGILRQAKVGETAHDIITPMAANFSDSMIQSALKDMGVHGHPTQDQIEAAELKLINSLTDFLT